MYVGSKHANGRSGQGGDKNCARCFATLDILFSGVTTDNVMGIIGSYTITPGNQVSLLASMHTTWFQLTALLTGAQGLFKLRKLAGPLYSNTRLIQKVSTVSLLKKSNKASYKILLLSDSTFFKLFFHIFAAIIEALIVAGHKFLYTLLIECGRR